MPSRPTRRVLLAGTLLLLLGGVVGDQTAAAVGDTAETPAKTRVGTIVRFDAASMDVRVDDGTLPGAPYLSTFQPVIGERVLVQQFGQTWTVMGPFAGAPPDNPVPNPSFEDGTDGSIPTGWTQLNPVTGAGTPAFTRQPTLLGMPYVDGTHVGNFDFDPSAPGFSESQAVSSPVAVAAGQRWSVSAYVSGVFLAANDATGYVAIGWYPDASTTTPSSTSVVAGVNVPRDSEWRLLASLGESTGVEAPAGSPFMRVILGTQFLVADDLDIYTIDWDRVVAWRVS